MPWQVSVQRAGRHICGGAIISNNMILTAAHCVYGEKTSNLSIRAGSSFHNSGGVLMSLKQSISHPKFDPLNFRNDVAVLKLSSKLAFNSTILPIKLSNKVPTSRMVVTTVSGWGALKESEIGLPTNLHSVAISVIPKKECSQSYPGQIYSGMFCAGHSLGQRDSCQGDSGGVLIYKTAALGIVSWGTGCARPGSPGVYTSVQYFRKWIISQM